MTTASILLGSFIGLLLGNLYDLKKEKNRLNKIIEILEQQSYNKDEYIETLLKEKSTLNK